MEWARGRRSRNSCDNALRIGGGRDRSGIRRRQLNTLWWYAVRGRWSKRHFTVFRNRSRIALNSFGRSSCSQWLTPVIRSCRRPGITFCRLVG
jgi:hypothetical protein